MGIKLTKPEVYVISDADRAVCGGSAELRPCPHCGGEPISGGRINEQTGNTVYQVICNNSECGAVMTFCSRYPEDARVNVVERWNRRVYNFQVRVGSVNGPSGSTFS